MTERHGFIVRYCTCTYIHKLYVLSLMHLTMYPIVPLSVVVEMFFSVCVLYPLCSKELLRLIALVQGVEEEGFPQLVSDLAMEKDGMSLVYMHHNDSLRSGTSYQNEARISLKDKLKVSTGIIQYHVHLCMYSIHSRKICG